MLLLITKRRITTNANNNQNCKKIKPHGTLTTKEIKKHSSSLVGDVKISSWVERTCCKAANHAGEMGTGGPDASKFIWVNRRNKRGARQTAKPRILVWETKDSKLLAVKFCGSYEGGRNSQSHRRVRGRDP